MSSNKSLIKQLQDVAGDEALETTKYKKETSEAHSSRATERAEEKIKPRLTLEKLRSLRVDILPEPINPDPYYRYKWGSLDQVASAELTDDLNFRNYSVVTQQEMPEMAMYVRHKGNKIDNSITKDAIMVKEMILLKVPKEDWELIMTESHHNLPAQREREIKAGFADRVRSEAGMIGSTRFDAEESASMRQREYASHLKEGFVEPAYNVGLNNQVIPTKPNFK